MSETMSNLLISTPKKRVHDNTDFPSLSLSQQDGSAKGRILSERSRRAQDEHTNVQAAEALRKGGWHK